MDYMTTLMRDTADEVAGRGQRVRAQHPAPRGEWGNESIGYLVASKHVLCFSCFRADFRALVQCRAVTLYRVNIDRYEQGCHACDAVLHEGAGEGWPELFTQRDCTFDDCQRRQDTGGLEA